MQNTSEDDFSCELKLDLKIRKRAPHWAWLVAPVLFFYRFAAFWHLVEKYLERGLK